MIFGVDFFALPGVIAALVAIIGFALKRLDKRLNFIALAVIFSLFEDMLARYLSLKYHSNSWMHYFADPIQYLILSCFFLRISSNAFTVKLIKISNICLFIYIVINLISTKSPYPAVLFLATGFSFLLAIFSISYIRDLFVINDGYFVLDAPILVVITGLLFFNAFCAIYFSLLVYLGDTPVKYLNPQIKVKLAQIAPLSSITYLLMNFSIIIGLLISMFKKKEIA